MNQNKGVIDIIISGDFVSHAIALLLLSLSVISWVVFLYKYFNMYFLSKNIPAYIEKFWQQDNMIHANNFLQEHDKDYTAQLSNSLIEVEHLHGHQASLPKSQLLSKILRTKLQALHYKIHIGHNFLATVGSTSPFIGLFGTVWGIYHALASISGSGQVSIDKIAGPVGEALIMTAFGLLVALPAVVAYNILSKKSKIIYQTLDGFAKDLYSSNEYIKKG